MSPRRVPVRPVPITAALAPDAHWYKDAVFYELHVRAFADSNADGIGDLRGLIGKLDYLRDLGVTALWLLPFYPSPLRDDGYDIADYRRIHPSYGTMRDFRELLKQAHARGLRVITELVLAHTSDQHPWFQRARSAIPGSVWRDFYMWSDTADRFRDARVIFKDFETSNWTYDPDVGQYYWHRFYSHQPSLNYDNEAVRKEIIDVVDYWLTMGVDGLRLDAVPYLYSREGTTCENLPETFQFLRELRSHVDERYAGRMLLAEANQWPEDAVAYLDGGRGCHMAFHFPLMPRMFMAARQEDRFPIVDVLTETPPIDDSNQWALFLRNHDELTLEMVTDEERDYMYRAYAEDPQARVNVGIRRRLAPLLENDRKMIEMMNGLLFALPGSPIIYYGDEIGMGDNIYLGDRGAVRTPMQWDGDRNAGFSKANPQRLYLPVIIDPEFHAQAINVAAQEQNPSSLLWWMRRLIGLRNRYAAFSRGSLEILRPDNRKVFAFLRRYGEEIVLVVVNLSRFTQAVMLDLSEFASSVPIELFGSTEFPPIGNLPYFVTLGPHGFYWFAIEPSRAAIASESWSLEVNGSWRSIFAGVNRAAFERFLLDYLPTRRWFREKSRRVRTIEIDDVIVIDPAGVDSSPHLVIAHATFDHGVPVSYVLAMSFISGSQAEELQQLHPEAVLCSLVVDGEPGVLYDACWDSGFGATLLKLLLRRRQLVSRTGRLHATPTPALRSLASELVPQPLSIPIGADQSNTSIVLDNHLIAKLIRRIEYGINPGFEIGRFLSEGSHFANVPKMAGQLEYRPANSTDRDVASVVIFEEFLPNEGDGWHYVLDALGHSLEEAVAHLADAQLWPLSAGALSDEQLSPIEAMLIGPHLQWAELLGLRTAELHLALASATRDPAFTPERLTSMDRQSMWHAARSLWRTALRSVRGLDEHPPLLDEVLQCEAQLLEEFQSLLSRKSINVTKIRVHGDYHLGQVLWTGKDFAIIDFEGEPSRALSARRLKRSALVDVAGMLRSFHYASEVAASRLQRELFASRGRDVLDPLLRAWYNGVANTFLSTYQIRSAAAAASYLPEDSADFNALLRFFELEKAVYELGYEANSRPDWVEIPCRGLLALLGVDR